jgi:hypothetical protein
MTIRILVAAVGIGLMLANPGWAQSSTTPTASFDSLSPGNQKIANALFSAQNTTGTTRTPLTKDQIAGLKGTEGWGKVFKEMKADGLVQAKNLGQVVSANQHQLNASRRGAGGTTAGTASSAARRGNVNNASMTNGRGFNASMTNGRGFTGGSRATGGGGAVSSMGGGGFGHAGMMGGMGGMGGGMGGMGGMGGGGGHGGGGGRGR